MKRIVSLVLALSMVLSMFATAFAGTTLTDIVGTEYESAVSALVELGDYDAASILYLEMYDKMLEQYGMKSTRIKPTTLKLVNPDCKGQF